MVKFIIHHPKKKFVMLLGSQSLVNDPYYNDVVLLLRGYDATSGQVFKDYSKYNRTITANGNVAHSTTQKKYGNSSISFDGSGDYLTTNLSSDFILRNSSFTAEFWVNLNNTGNLQVLLAVNGGTMSWGSVSGYQFVIYRKNDGRLMLERSVSGFATTTEGINTIPLGQWVHIATVFDGVNLKIYLNGQQEISVSTWDNLSYTNARVIIGTTLAGHPYDYFLSGYNEDLRITRRARDIVVPTQPFPNW